jgi:GTP-binding protein
MSLFQNATYFVSAHNLRDLPPPGQPEIAFVGRSNAGKSSAINALADRKALAFVSKAPGRTQQINFFRLAGGGILVDLPGYGYSRVPATLRTHWEATLGVYLRTRSSLCGVALIMDARHTLTERDDLLISWIQPTAKPIHVLLTKADKLSRSGAVDTLAYVKTVLAQRGIKGSVQLFSSHKRTGVDEAELIFGRWIEAATRGADGCGGESLPRPSERSSGHRGHKKAPGQRGKPRAKRLK